MRRINHFQRFAPLNPSVLSSLNRIRPTLTRTALSIKPCQNRLVPLSFNSRWFHVTSPSFSEPLKQPTEQSNQAPITPSSQVPVDPTVIPTTTQSVTPVAKESRFRRLFRQYGAVAVGTYAVMYVSTLGMIYVAVHNRWVGSVDVEHWIEWLGVSSHFENIDPKNGGDFIIAWLATKLTEPIRLAVAVAITPTIARMLGRAPTKAQNAAAKQHAKEEKAIKEAADAAAEEAKKPTSPSSQ